jgi:hypothetical protein
MSVKPVNGECPEGYIYVAGGDDGKSGGSCMKNPFAIKSNKDGVYEYDKRTTSFAGKYAKAILDKMPKELRNEDVYNDIIHAFVFSTSLSKSSPLYEVIQLTNQGDVAGLNKILSDISSGNNTKYLDYEINSWNEFGKNKRDNIKKASDFPAITEIQYPYPRSSEKSKKEIDAENFYQTNPKSRFAGITGEEINPNNYGTTRNASGAITNTSKGLTPFQTPRGFESDLFDNPGITVDSETQDRINFNQQRISDIQKLSEGIKNQIDSGIGTDGKKLSNKDLESLRSQLNGNNEAVASLKNELRSAGQSMPLGVSQSFGTNDIIAQAQQQQTPPAQPVIPPANPQGQVEFMQQQAQQMPVPNEVSSRTQLPPMASNMPEAEQQVGMQEEMPQDNGSIFQRLRNLFSGKQPQSPQSSVAPQVTPQTTPQQPVDNRIMGGGAGDGSAMNEMMPKEFQNAQNLGQQVTQPGMFGGGVSDGGSMGQSSTTGLSGAFANAGESPIGTTGAVAGTTNVNTGALPKEVVKPAQTTGAQPTGQVGGQVAGQVGGQVGGQVTGQTGTQTGGGTPPPAPATPGIVGGGMGNPLVNVLNNQVVETVNEKGQKSKSMQDLIEIGGTGFDDEVLARKLRRQAAMPDLKNEDYYPNEPFTQAQTAWGDPIFSGAGALFPMAAYDAQRKARAQAEIEEAQRDVMQIKIPEIKTGAYYQRFRGDFTNEVTNAVNEAVKQVGGNRQKAMRYLRESGILAQIENKYNGLARSIDQTADRAKDFLKNAQEKSATMYFSPEGVRAATNFMNGMEAYSNGQITPEQLNQLEQQFNTAERWETYKKNALEEFTDDEVVPGLGGDSLTPEEEVAFQKQINLPGGFKDKRHFLLVTKYSKANKDKIIEGIVKPFFDTNRTAMEQWMKKENETENQVIDRIADGIVAMRGDKIWQDVLSESEEKGINITNVMGGTPSSETGVYYNTAMNNDKILDYISKNLNANNIDEVLSNASSIADATKSYKPDKDYFGFRIPGKWDAVNADVTPSAFSTYVIPDANNPSRLKTLTANDAIGVKDAPANLAPTSAKIKDIVYTYGIPDPSAPGGYRLITKTDIKKTGVLPPNAEPVVVRHDELRYNMEDSEGGGVNIYTQTPTLTQDKTGTKQAKDIRTKIAYKIFPATAETLRYYDDLASPGRKNESVPGSVPAGSTGNSNSGSWVK